MEENVDLASILDAEELIRTVARAFYSDNYILVLDALIREKYIIDLEIGPRLKLSQREVNKITHQLMDELMVKKEKINSQIFCFYIDYQLFVDSVRYRVDLMQKMLKMEEKNELNELFYVCPTCDLHYSVVQAASMLCTDYRFACSHCAVDNFRELPSADHYRLIEVDNKGMLVVMV